MRLKFKLILLPATLLVCVLVTAAQEQQSPQKEPQPQASSPNQTSPENTAPQNTEPKPGASNPAAPESSAGKNQAPQEQPPANAQTPASPNQQSSAAQEKPPSKSTSSKSTSSKSTSKSSRAVRKKSAKASPGHAHHATRRHKPVTDPSGKVVVRNGGARDASIQLSPASNQQDSQDRKNTDQLLVKADDNLKRVAGQQLTATQQSTVDQIRTYMRQAKSAVDAGDLARAHTLALKAHLLSVDLTKR